MTHESTFGYTVGKPIVYLSSIRLCRERFETMLVATIRHLPDVSSRVLCLIGNNKEETLCDVISDAFRDTAPNYMQECLNIRVERLDTQGNFLVICYSEDEDGSMMHPPRASVVNISDPIVYGKD